MTQNIHRMVQELGDLICSMLDGPLTIVGIMTGGEYISRDLSKYLTERGRECRTFNIRVDKENGCVLDGKDLIRNDRTTYVFVDDAIWTSRTRDIIARYSEEIGINYKYAVFLDPYKKADFSLYSD